MGHVGLDQTRLTPTSVPRLTLGGSAFHYAVASGVFGSPTDLSTIVGPKTMELLKDSVLNLYMPSPIMLSEADTVFDLAYDLSSSQELRRLDIAGAPPPGQLYSHAKDIVENYDEIHVCPMPLVDARALVSASRQRDKLSSMQLHSTLISRHPEEWARTCAGVDRVFLSESEFSLLEPFAVPDSRRLPETEWVITSDRSVRVIRGASRQQIHIHPIRNVVDPTAAGDCFAGAFSALRGTLRPAIAARFAAAIAALTLTDFSSQAVARLLAWRLTYWRGCSTRGR